MSHRHIIPALLEKFTDSKILVRKEAVKVLRRLMAASSPKKVFDLAALGISHTSWRVREEVLNLGIMVSQRGSGHPEMKRSDTRE